MGTLRMAVLGLIPRIFFYYCSLEWIVDGVLEVPCLTVEKGVTYPLNYFLKLLEGT